MLGEAAEKMGIKGKENQRDGQVAVEKSENPGLAKRELKNRAGESRSPYVSSYSGKWYVSLTG